jgi:hypothetical protein
MMYVMLADEGEGEASIAPISRCLLRSVVTP